MSPTMQHPDRFPRKVRLVHYRGRWVVLATYGHFWPNGDACTVHYGGETRRRAIWSFLRGIV